jgi:hypothetical protein
MSCYQYWSDVRTSAGRVIREANEAADFSYSTAPRPSGEVAEYNQTSVVAKLVYLIQGVQGNQVRQSANHTEFALH